MKKTSLITYVLLLALLIPVASVEGAPKAKKKQIGIATYSVKGLESDVEGSLKALGDFGYTVMEISNYNAGRGTVAGYSPADYAALAKKYGLNIISSHARAKFDAKDVAGTLEAWGKLLDDHKIMGCKYVVLPMNDVEALKAECSLLNQIGAEANKRGIKFGYHNHSMEFATVPTTNLTFEDFLIQNTDPDKVFFQMDVYWITIGGMDPVTYLKKYPDRFSVLHIKDDYVIGESGKIDYKAIFKQFYKNGHKDWFVEMEAKMTDEQRKQSIAMMDMMKQRMSQGGQGQQGQPQGPPQGQAGQRQGPPQGQQAGAPPQGRQGGAPAGNAGGFGQRDPQAQAAMLKESLDGIRLSAEYLKNAKFVK